MGIKLHGSWQQGRGGCSWLCFRPRGFTPLLSHQPSCSNSLNQKNYLYPGGVCFLTDFRELNQLMEEHWSGSSSKRGTLSQAELGCVYSPSAAQVAKPLGSEGLVAWKYHTAGLD